MKKFLIYLLVFSIIIFIIPIVCTKKRIEVSSMVDEENMTENTTIEEIQNTYQYFNYSTIKLLHTKTQQIEELALDEYLKGVVSSEMPASYEFEALKAQATVARTYTIYQIINGKQKHGEANLCDSPNCCQAWISKEDRMSKWSEEEKNLNWQKIVNAVNSTAGKIITYDGKPIDAFFHANSGGVTEVALNVWGGSNFPYLKSVETSGEEGYAQYSSEVEFSKDQIINKLKEKYQDISINFDEQDSIKILEYTESRKSKKY